MTHCKYIYIKSQKIGKKMDKIYKKKYFIKNKFHFIMLVECHAGIDTYCFIFFFYHILLYSCIIVTMVTRGNDQQRNITVVVFLGVFFTFVCEQYNFLDQSFFSLFWLLVICECTPCFGPFDLCLF